MARQMSKKQSEYEADKIASFALRGYGLKITVQVQAAGNGKVGLAITLRNPTRANLARLRSAAIVALHRDLLHSSSARLPIGRVWFPIQNSQNKPHLVIEISSRHAPAFSEIWRKKKQQLESEETGAMGPEAFRPFVVRGAQEMKSPFPAKRR